MRARLRAIIAAMIRSLAIVLLLAVPAAASGTLSEPIDLRLRAVQAAAERGEREAFGRAFGELAKALLALLPERVPAYSMMKVYRDLDRIWAFQLDTPDASFFTEASGLREMLGAYAGYDEFIGPRVLKVRGETLYPMRESREFLVREAARQLERLR